MTAHTLGVCGHDHLVQFYATDEFLVETVCAFLVPALRDGDAAIVTATAAHREAFDCALAGAGIDVDAAVREGRYLSLDAAGLLSRLMVAGKPDIIYFSNTIGAVMDYASRDGRKIRVYDEVGSAAFTHICEQHAAAIACEGRSAPAGHVEQARSVANLQQEVAMLTRGNEQIQQSRSILDAAGDGIFGADASGALTFVNPAALQMTGYAHEELIGRDMHDLLHHTRADGSPYPRSECPALRSLADNVIHHSDDDVYWRKDGTAFAVECTSTPIVGDDGITGAVVVIRDVTERLEAERVKDEFTSVVSHELRTPLTSIRASLGLLESGALGPLSAEGRRMLQIAVQNTDRLVRLIGDILDIERIDSGSTQLQTTSCDAADLVTCAIDAVRATAVDAEVSIEMDAPPAAFSADADRIVQALTNLIANAVKFSAPGGTVRIKSERRDGEMLFAVSDHGRGIPADKLETIFERFTQIESPGARRQGGTGLGLAICRSIVERHGGRIWARSEPGEGSTFTFVIPAERGEDQWHPTAATTTDPDLMPVCHDVRVAA